MKIVYGSVHDVFVLNAIRDALAVVMDVHGDGRYLLPMICRED